MLKKTISYTDYDGHERTENFYFSLNKAEIMEMELSVAGGLRKMLQIIVEMQDIPKIMEIFKDLIKKSYGEKSPDGRRFIKSEALTDAFLQTEAYSELYIELLSSADKAAAFVNGIIPEEIAKYAEEHRENAQKEAGSTEGNESESTEDGDASLLKTIEG